MRLAQITVTLVLLSMIAPLGFSGSVDEPEATDDAGDAFAAGKAVPALDITAAWFSTTTYPFPLRGLSQGPSIVLTFQLADLGLASPVADGTNENVVYEYRADWTLNGRPQRLTCFIYGAHLPTDGFILMENRCQVFEGGSQRGAGTIDVDTTNHRVIATNSAFTSGDLIDNVVLSTASWQRSGIGLEESFIRTVDTAESAPYVVGS